MCVCSVRQPMRVFLRRLPFEPAAESSAAPRSLRTSCSFLLAAMKGNQSTAVSPGPTSAFNYRAEQQEERGGRLPPLRRSRHVPALTRGRGRQRPVHALSVPSPYRLGQAACFHAGVTLHAGNAAAPQIEYRLTWGPNPNKVRDYRLPAWTRHVLNRRIKIQYVREINSFWWNKGCKQAPLYAFVETYIISTDKGCL